MNEFKIAIEHFGRRTRDVPGAKVLHHLIGLQHIGANLMAPTDVGLGRGVRVDLLFARLKLSLIKSSAQHIPGGRSVLVL